MGTITHHHQTALPDNGRSDVSANVWNAGHDFSLTASDVGLASVLNAVYRPPLAADTTVNVPSQYATLEAALAYAAIIDFAGHTLTIQLAAGTYTSISGSGFVVPVTTGQANASNLIIKGDTTTPSNVILTGAATFTGIVVCNTAARCRVTGIQFKASSNGFGLNANSGGYIEYTAVDFNSGLFAGAVSQAGGTTSCVGTCTISATMPIGIYATNGGYAFQIGSTVTTANTPVWTAGYAWADAISFIRVAGGTTFGGSGATGPRYSANRNGVIDTSGGGATYFPGDSAGTTGTGGLYS